MKQEELLLDLGLSDREAKTYMAILELGSSPIKPIAQRSGVKRTSIYNFIDRLVGMGLITQTKVGRATHYQAAPPTRLAELQRERLRAIENALPEFNALFNTLSTKPRIHYFEGSEQIKNIAREELGCKKQASYIWPDAATTEAIGGTRFMQNIDKERIRKGVSIRSLRAHQPTEHLFETSRSGKEFLREIRFAPPQYKIAVGMGLYDTGKVSFFGKEGFGVLIDSRDLHQLMSLLFELLWKQSKPARVGEG
ncbi:MAG: Transcriptional regulator, TrmB [Berkelbacteria bacterium GW2011_GWA2_46_7]|uniref:Transcriptional regulator, TrmB n=1 Tax=Berkelbacteria bacterium GW2011_GWA2_46_7 TaxID=1618335 RepID=A0A0G1QE79_9BACT|nr:MAG: Transcriptional regulator, TrmB [Berkelbacteria bacterium GW2011_GWA2_46_7]